MVGWHHQLHGHEFEQALGDGDGRGSLASRSPGGLKESDMTVTEQQHWFLSQPPSSATAEMATDSMSVNGGAGVRDRSSPTLRLAPLSAGLQGVGRD